MAYFFTLLLLVSLVLLVIGFFNPQKALFWKKGSSTRQQSAIIYSMAAVLSLSVIGLTAPDPPGNGIGTKGYATQKGGEEAATSTPENSSEREMELALFRSCDTEYTVPAHYPHFNHDTGYLVAGPGAFYKYEGNLLEMDKWKVSTYKQTGPDAFDEDDTKKLTSYQQVRVMNSEPGFSQKLSSGYLVVAPLGSDQTYIIQHYNFTLKNITQCSLVQKARNKFCVKASYIPPSDPSKRPLTDAAPQKWLDIPPHAIIVILYYNPATLRITGEVFDPAGHGVNGMTIGQFYAETLGEIK